MGVGSVGQKNEGGQIVQTFAIKISKFQSYNVQHGDYS